MRQSKLRDSLSPPNSLHVKDRIYWGLLWTPPSDLSVSILFTENIMSIKTPSGMSLSKGYFKAKHRFEWVSKVYGNVRRKLNRIADLVALSTETFESVGTVILYWSGENADLQRISKVLGVSFVPAGKSFSLLEAVEPVKFSRLNCAVLLVQRPHVIVKLNTPKAA